MPQITEQILCQECGVWLDVQERSVIVQGKDPRTNIAPEQFAAMRETL
jgi:hypothetical protein